MPNKPLTNGYCRLVVGMLAVVLVMVGCQARDRAGGQAGAEVTELRFALNSLPDATITAWAAEVDQLSDSTLKITFLTDTRTGQPDAEAGLIADVRAGSVDLAWVGARAFDQVGLTTFQPLVAPMLIDSLELEGKVFDAGIPQQLLPSLRALDLVGVGVLPGPIRKVLGVTKPFTGPADFTGQVVGIQASDVAERSLSALGATPKAVPGSAELTGLDAYEQQLSAIQGNHYALNAKYVTGNLNLWPRPRVIIANPDVHQRLTDDQRAILAAVSEHTVRVAMEAERGEEADSITALCRAGLTFAQSSDDDLAALQKALAPISRAIGKDPANAAVLEKVTTIKSSLHRAPDRAECSQPTESQSTAASPYDGTYRYTVDEGDASQYKRCPTDSKPQQGIVVAEIDLHNGVIQQWNWPQGHEEQREIGWEGTYTFFKDQLLLVESSGGRTSYDFSYDGKALTLSNMRPKECDSERVWADRPWIRQ